ncbi:MAG: phosphoribosylamine--glycine ligase, partial [Bacteroidota bacterium]
MNVAIIGSGGREHALAYKIKQSDKLDDLFILPGNAGTLSLGKNVSIETNDHKKVTEFCLEHAIDLVVIGPEIPLVHGLGDALRGNNISVFGPNQNAAMIEGDKSFSKHLMRKYEIPTAEYKIFNKEDYVKCISYLDTISYPTVIKASGLAAGKGVLICMDKNDAVGYVDQCFKDDLFGKSSEVIVIEEFLEGEEASVFAITDGTDYILLPAAQDHKRRFDGDKGPNTGGMGAYAPAPLVTDEIMKRIEEEVIVPTLNAMKQEGREYSGCLYAGLMINDGKPSVVEFNCRFGDPETQVVLPIIDGDLLELLYSASKGEINKETVSYNGKTSVCVVAASDGYPGSYQKGLEIEGLQEMPDGVEVFHAGTKLDEGKVLTNGGRVLAVSSIIEGQDIQDAKVLAYEGLNKIEFTGKV